MNKMERKVVIDTGCLYRLNSDYKVLDLIKSVGFKYFDLSLFWIDTTEHIGVGDDYIENAKALRKYADSLGLECVQSHSYFTNGISEEVMNKRYHYIQKEMRIAKIMGAKSIVIHPILEYSFDQNIEYIKRFIPLAHELDIIIDIENIWATNSENKICPMCTSTPESFVRFLDTLNDDHVLACLDIGHAEMNQMGTSAVDMIKALSKRIYCLHIHDNDKWCDAHQIPYTQKINFNAILRALKDIDYKGDITFEVETCYNRGENPDANLPFELFQAFAKLELEIGNYFVKYLDE